MPSLDISQVPQSDESPPDTTNGSPFTTANLFSQLVMLGLCLLSQPYGSLLYPQPRTKFGRAVFFFWRLNPLAAVTEAMIALLLLRDISVGSRTLSRQGANERWLKKNGISVILLMRSQSSLLQAYRQERERASERIAWRELQARSEAVILLSPSTARLRQQDPTPEAQPSQHMEETVEPRSSNHLQAPLEPRSQYSWSFIIDLVSLLAIGLTIIKLCVISMPWHIQVLLWLYIASFLVCHLLVLLSHITPVHKPNAYDLCRVTDDLDWYSRRPLSILSAFVCMLPTVGYISYSACFPNRLLFLEPVLEILIAGLISMDWVIYLIISHYFTAGESVSGWFFKRGQQLLGKSHGHKAEVDTDDNTGARTSPPQQESPEMRKSTRRWIVELTIDFIIGSAAQWALDHSFLPMFGHQGAHNLAVFICIFIFSLCCLFWHKRDNEFTQTIGLMLNIVMAIFTIASMLVHYDDKSTYKPEWLEWLG